MRIRHRVPSIFNLSMVDVLCCALGCVILLWLLNLREAKQKAEEAGKTDQRLVEVRDLLAVTSQERDDLRSRLDQATAQLDDLTEQARKLRNSLADSARQLADANQHLVARDKELADLRTTRKDALDRLARQAQDYGDLEKKLSASVQRVTALEGQLRDKDALADANGRRADSAMSKLNDAEGRLRKLQALADLIPGLQEDVKKYRDRFATEEALANGLEKEIGERMRDLAVAAKELKELRASRQALEQDVASRDKDLGAMREQRTKLAAAEERVGLLAKEVAARTRDLSAATARIEDLVNDKKALRGETDRLRAAADNRFAGITLTGRRVIFLVDMSGSMKLVDESTPAPEKWVAVRETLAKVLRSLPQVEKVQVIAFAEKVLYPLGEDGRWLDYDPATSADRAVQALGAIEPTGGTNMYDGLRAAVGFRDQGLDTIYLLSDGLPNLGEGLTAEQAKSLTEQQQGEILGRHMRRTLKEGWNRPDNGRRVRINTIGFFFESPDVGAFLWALARENDGSFVGMSRP
jgi:septal ring factor EnvC (AmiA/AmiB activator)